MSKEFQIRDGNLIASFDLENEDGDIDCCKLLKVSHGVADEIGMFVDYVVTNKIIEDQSKQISDLEAKLAEMKKTNEYFLDRVKKADKEIKENYKNYNKLVEEYNELKQQLAEKDEQHVQSLIKLEKEYDEQLEKQAKIHYRHLKEKDQDKISFAVEQLEKVKDFVKENESWEIEGSDYSIVYADDVLVRIDNQIEELKKEMK